MLKTIKQGRLFSALSDEKNALFKTKKCLELTGKCQKIQFFQVFVDIHASIVQVPRDFISE